MKKFLSLTFIFSSVSSLVHNGNGSSCVTEYLRRHDYLGSIEESGSEEYVATLSIDNKRVAVNPSLVLVPTNEHDVALAVKATRSCHLPFSIISGGHSAGGYCLSKDGITLNIRDGLNHVKLLENNAIGGTVHVESGALWEDVYRVTNDTAYLPIGGGCTTVGSGFILGGGWSFLSRSYGLGSDNVLSFRLVLANGTAITASKDENADVFWTLGAGGGNFGVVTSFVLQTHPPRSSNMLVGEYCWEPFDPAIPELWTFWFEQFKIWPDWMDIEPVWLLIAPESTAAETVRQSRHAHQRTSGDTTDVSTDPRMFCFTVICNGDPDSECAPYVNPIAAKYPPVINSVQAQPFMQWQMANVEVTDAQDGYLYLTSGILPPGALTTEVITQLMDALKTAPSDQNLVLFHAGRCDFSH